MDFQKITRELVATGLTQDELAGLVPCSQPTISSFLTGKRGSRPSLQIGTRLIALHKERVLDAGKPLIGRRKEDVDGTGPVAE